MDDVSNFSSRLHYTNESGQYTSSSSGRTEPRLMTRNQCVRVFGLLLENLFGFCCVAVTWKRGDVLRCQCVLEIL